MKLLPIYLACLLIASVSVEASGAKKKPDSKVKAKKTTQTTNPPSLPSLPPQPVQLPDVDVPKIKDRATIRNSLAQLGQRDLIVTESQESSRRWQIYEISDAGGIQFSAYQVDNPKKFAIITFCSQEFPGKYSCQEQQGFLQKGLIHDGLAKRFASKQIGAVFVNFFEVERLHTWFDPESDREGAFSDVDIQSCTKDLVGALLEMQSYKFYFQYAPLYMEKLMYRHSAEEPLHCQWYDFTRIKKATPRNGIPPKGMKNNLRVIRNSLIQMLTKRIQFSKTWEQDVVDGPLKTLALELSKPESSITLDQVLYDLKQMEPRFPKNARKI